MQLPAQFLQSLQGLQGFDKASFIEAHSHPKPLTSIRINSEKYSIEQFNQSINQLQISNDNVAWCNDAFYVAVRPVFTAQPAFHAGGYYVQDASSMFLWQVLKQLITAPENKKVLDVCAAPGGKSTLLANVFKDGLLVSNEVIKTRVNVLEENLTKWGSDNVIVTNNDPQNFQRLPNFFDVIVADAPCSGSGLFRKNEEAMDEWSINNVQLCNQRQQRIVADILPCLAADGLFIYSTCSYAKEENENMVDWILKEFELESLPIQLQESWGIVETLSDDKKGYGYRFYPNKVKGEGFFIAAFKSVKTNTVLSYKETALTAPQKKEAEMIDQSFGLGSQYFTFKQGDDFIALPEKWGQPLKQLAAVLYIKKAGIELGCIKGKDVIPAHSFALSNLPKTNFNSTEVCHETALQFLRKKEFELKAPIGWNLLTHQNLGLGWVKVLPNRINNYYPLNWRILKH